MRLPNVFEVFLASDNAYFVLHFVSNTQLQMITCCTDTGTNKPIGLGTWKFSPDIPPTTAFQDGHSSIRWRLRFYQ